MKEMEFHVLEEYLSRFVRTFEALSNALMSESNRIASALQAPYLGDPMVTAWCICGHNIGDHDPVVPYPTNDVTGHEPGHPCLFSWKDSLLGHTYCDCTHYVKVPPLSKP